MNSYRSAVSYETQPGKHQQDAKLYLFTYNTARRTALMIVNTVANAAQVDEALDVVVIAMASRGQGSSVTTWVPERLEPKCGLPG